MKPKITSFTRYEYYETGGRDSSTVRNQNNNAANQSTNAAVSSFVKLPIFARSELETEVIVRSGETVVMGGLITTRENRNEYTVPFLSSIPIIGRLFRHDVHQETSDNLLIFVTATILSEWGEDLLPESEESAAPETAVPGPPLAVPPGSAGTDGAPTPAPETRPSP
jgi:type II secretory pathway component GspD/PulD (secretin)